MSVDEIMAHGADVLLDQFGEDIGYSRKGTFPQQTIRAIVNREPVNSVGEFLANTIEISISRDAVPEVFLNEDRFFLPGPGPFDPPVDYHPTAEASKLRGIFWDLVCVKH